MLNLLPCPPVIQQINPQHSRPRHLLNNQTQCPLHNRLQFLAHYQPCNHPPNRRDGPPHNQPVPLLAILPHNQLLHRLCSLSRCLLRSRRQCPRPHPRHSLVRTLVGCPHLSLPVTRLESQLVSHRRVPRLSRRRSRQGGRRHLLPLSHPYSQQGSLPPHLQLFHQHSPPLDRAAVLRRSPVWYRPLLPLCNPVLRPLLSRVLSPLRCPHPNPALCQPHLHLFNLHQCRAASLVACHPSARVHNLLHGLLGSPPVVLLLCRPPSLLLRPASFPRRTPHRYHPPSLARIPLLSHPRFLLAYQQVSQQRYRQRNHPRSLQVNRLSQQASPRLLRRPSHLACQPCSLLRSRRATLQGNPPPSRVAYPRPSLQLCQRANLHLNRLFTLHPSHLPHQRDSLRGNRHVTPLANPRPSHRVSHLHSPLDNRLCILARNLLLNRVGSPSVLLRSSHRRNRLYNRLRSHLQIPLGNQLNNPQLSHQQSLHANQLHSHLVFQLCNHLCSPVISLPFNLVRILLRSRQSSRAHNPVPYHQYSLPPSHQRSLRASRVCNLRLIQLASLLRNLPHSLLHSLPCSQVGSLLHSQAPSRACSRQRNRLPNRHSLHLNRPVSLAVNRQDSPRLSHLRNLPPSRLANQRDSHHASLQDSQLINRPCSLQGNPV